MEPNQARKIVRCLLNEQMNQVEFKDCEDQLGIVVKGQRGGSGKCEIVTVNNTQCETPISAF